MLYKKRGANVIKIHATTKCTVLHISALMGHHMVVDYLLTFTGHKRLDQRSEGQTPQSCKIDINLMDAENKTPLMLAAERGKS